MNTFWKWIFLTGYVIVVSFIFLYFLFPDELVRRYAQSRLSAIQPGISVDIADASPSLPLGLKFTELAVKVDDKPQMVIETLRVKPEIVSLIKGSPVYSYLTQTYGGSIEGSILTYGDDTDGRLSGRARIQDLDIQKFPSSKNHPHFSVAGKLQGDLLFNRDRRGEFDLDAQFEVSEASVELTSPLTTLKTISFKNIQADLKIHNRSVILNNLSLKGPQLDGRVSGSLYLRNDFKQSVLNLSGKFKPHHLLLASIGKGFQSFLLPAAKKKELDGISFRIVGTIGRPRFSIEPAAG